MSIVPILGRVWGSAHAMVGVSGRRWQGALGGIIGVEARGVEAIQGLLHAMHQGLCLLNGIAQPDSGIIPIKWGILAGVVVHGAGTAYGSSLPLRQRISLPNRLWCANLFIEIGRGLIGSLIAVALAGILVAARAGEVVLVVLVFILVLAVGLGILGAVFVLVALMLILGGRKSGFNGVSGYGIAFFIIVCGHFFYFVFLGCGILFPGCRKGSPGLGFADNVRAYVIRFIIRLADELLEVWGQGGFILADTPCLGGIFYHYAALHILPAASHLIHNGESSLPDCRMVHYGNLNNVSTNHGTVRRPAISDKAGIPDT